MTETSKYNVSKKTDNRTFDGIVFDSAVEMKFYKEVVIPGVKKGTITSFELQKKFELQPKFKHKGKQYKEISYIADFVLTYPDGHIDVIDIKGMPDHVAPIKRKLFCYKFQSINLYWVCYSKLDGGWCTYEHLKAQRSKRKREKAKKAKKEK